jgi:hypothetical protein
LFQIDDDRDRATQREAPAVIDEGDSIECGGATGEPGGLTAELRGSENTGVGGRE